VLFEILLQGTFLREQVSIFVIDEYFLVFQVINSLVVDIVDRVRVVECIGRCLLPARTVKWRRGEGRRGNIRSAMKRLGLKRRGA
jgi:hypothetical protein